MAQTKPKAGQFYGVSNNGTDGQFLKTDGTGGMSWDSPITNPTITSIDYPGSQTAADPAGGESVIINGTLFASGVTCTVGGTSAVTTFNSATQITITTPAKAAGQYTVTVTNPDGGTISQANFIQYSGVPVWSTASGNIGSVQSGSTASFQVTATEGSDTIEYAVTTGSLPSGLSLNTNTGAITGTAGSVSASTTTTFSITATDDENQTSSARSFNITVTPDLPSNHFAPYIYTGNGGAQNIPLNFSPGLTWIKSRTNSYDHNLYDIVRGADGQGGGSDKVLSTNKTNAQEQGDGDVTITSGGFTVVETTGSSSSSEVNLNGANYVSWNFKAGGTPTATNAAAAGSVPTLGSVMVDGTASTSALAGNVVAKKMSVNTALDFSVVDFTSVAGSTNQIPHGLSGTPDLFIFKRTDAAQDWYVYTEVIDGSLDYLVLNSSAAKSNSSETAPTATTVYQPTSTGARDYILYCFKSQPGFSKIGSYAGNGTTSHMIQTGFKPAFLMIKSYTDGGGWNIIDDKRNTNNPIDNVLYAEANSSEDVNSVYVKVNFLTNGFELLTNDSGINMSGRSYIYVAFAADPSTTTPSLANSFGADLYTGNNTTNVINTVGFKPDLTWVKTRNDNKNHVLVDSVRGVSSVLEADTTAGAVTGTDFTSFDTNGFTLAATNAVYMNPAGTNMVSWNWKAGGLKSINTDGTITSLVSANDAAGFSIVEYQTSGVQSIGHGLSSAPELVIQKSLDVSGGSYWGVYSAVSGMGTGKLLRLNENSSVFTDSFFFSAVGNSTFTTSWSGTVYKYINYCFRSITGYSKVGSYVGTGTTISAINVGFAPGFVMIKGIDNSGNWAMLDNKRGGTSRDQLDANDPHAEYANQGVTFTSTGFSPRQSVSSDTNTSGITYLYLAIKEN